MTILFFLILGVFSLSAQTVVLREYLVVFHGNELGIGFFYASWFFWIAIGAAAGLFSTQWAAFLHRKLPYLLLFYGMALPVQIALCRLLRCMAGVPFYEIIPPITLIGLTMLMNLPVSVLTGTLFPAGCRFFQSASAGKNKAVTLAYLFESLGSFAAGAVVTWLFFQGHNSIFITLISMAALGVAAICLSICTKNKIPLFLNAVYLAAVIAMLAGSFYKGLDRWLAVQRLQILSPKAELLEEIETPYQVATAAKTGGQTVIYSNGEIFSAFPTGTEFRDLAALISVQSKGLEKITLIGVGALPLIKNLLQYPVKEIRLVEQDKKMFEFIKKYAGSEAEFLNDSRVGVYYDDPVIFLSKLKDKKQDAIVLISTEPSTLVANRLFVKEFFSTARDCLKDNGFFLTEIRSAENFMGTELANYGRSLFVTLSSVFANVLITPGEWSVFIASDSEMITLDPEVLKKRFLEIFDKYTGFPADGFASMLPSDRVGKARELYEADPGFDLLNTQMQPRTFFLNLLVMFKETASPGVRLLKGLSGASSPPIFAAIVLLMILLGHYQVLSSHERLSSLAAMLLSLTGGAAISIQIILLTSFQARFGTLFVQLGLANAIFMIGLAAGGRLGLMVIRALKLRGIMYVLIFAALFAFAIPILTIRADYHLFHALFLISGFLSGALWPSGGSLLEERGQGVQGIAAVLDSADHWGAFVGAALFGIIILPVAGVQDASMGLGLMFILCIALVFVTDAVEKKPSIAKKAEPCQRPSVPIRRLAYGLVFVSILSVLYGHFFHKKLNPPKIQFTADELGTYIKADWFEEQETQFFHYAASVGGKKSVVFSSMSIVPEIRGFAGPVNLLFVINSRGVINRIALVESNETPTYIMGIDSFLEQFQGRDIRKGFVFSQQSGIDMMSGATVTSEAALQIINSASAIVGRELLNIDVKEPEASSIWSRLFRIDTLFIFAVISAAVFVYKYGTSKIRTGFLIFNLILAGLVFNLQFSIVQLIQLLRFQAPPIYDTSHFLLLWGAVFLAVVFGPVYCSHLCPFGALQELTGKFGRPATPTPHYAWYMRSIKYIVLAAVAVFAFHPNSHRIFSFDPLVNAFAFKFTLIPVLIIVTIMVASAFYFRFYCRYLCPVGAFFNLFNKIANKLPFRPKRNYGKCDLGVHSPRDIECIQCNRCVRGVEIYENKE